MSEHELPDDDPQLSDLYRRTAKVAPDARLDAVVISHARCQLADTRRARLRRWMPITSAAAVMVLAVGLVLRLQQQPDALMPKSGVDIVQEESAAAAAPMVAESAPVRGEGQGPVPEERVAREEQAVRSRALAVEDERAKAKTEAPAKAQLGEELTERKAVAAAPATTLNYGVAASEPAAVATLDMADEAKRVERAPQVAAPAATSVPLEKQAPALEPPEAWLKRIEALRAKGEIEAAKRELAAFRKAYPAWQLPKELQPLLPEEVK